MVTGGSGFIGTNLVEALVASGNTILNLDLRPPQVASHRPHWMQVDLMDQAVLDKAVVEFRPTHVIHLAARADLMGKTPEDYALNTTGTENLMRSLGKVPMPEHVLFTSTMLVCRPGYIPAHDTDFAPGTAYGTSKVDMERIIRSWDPPYRWNIIRPTSIWGPWFASPYRDFFDRVMQGKMFSIGGIAPATKTYGFVLNGVRQIMAILDAPDIARGVYYIGDEPPVNIRMWTDMVATKAGVRRPPVVHHALIRAAGWVGDLFKWARIPFPMTSFRFKNMTTDNVLPLANTSALVKEIPYDLATATDITLTWLREHENK